MRVSINGKETEVAPGTTVAQLIDRHRLQPQHVAVEVNRQLVSRRTFPQAVLSEGDQIEIVTLVGGG